MYICSYIFNFMSKLRCHLSLITLVLFAIISLEACEEEIFSPVPYAPVRLSLDLRFEDSELNNVWATKAFTSGKLAADRLGFGGILVIHGVGVDGINLFAYDLACPVEVNREVKVVADDIGNAVCPKCKAVYNIANGSGAPVSGSKYFLKSYRVSSQGDSRYLISN
jgi:hypothetical protein